MNTQNLDELISFSKKYTMMRERAMEIRTLIKYEDEASSKLNDDYYTLEPSVWLERYDAVKQMQKRIKLKICAFAKRHYGADSICVEDFKGQDFVDTICRFFRLTETVYFINRA